MKKIMIVGSPGSGKSHFSRKLAEITGISVYHMDMIYHNPDSTTNPREYLIERVREILGGALTEGFEIVAIREIPWTEGTKHPENAMALVKGADYIMSLKDGYNLYPKNANNAACDIVNANALNIKLKEFLEKDSIIVSKKSKSGERDFDIRPYIYEAAIEDNSGIPDFMYADSEGSDKKTCLGTVHADVYEPGIRFFFRLSAGSEVNIKPELVLDAFLEFCGLEHQEFAFQIHRAQMFSDVEQAIGL